MNTTDLRIIVKGLLHDGLNTEQLTKTGRRELRAALDKVLELYDAILAPNGTTPRVSKRNSTR
jgi:hypothetical protein